MQPRWMDIANAEIGEQEIAGARDNPKIVEFHKATGMGAAADEVPWCGSFVTWALMKAGIKDYNRVNGARARSWMDWGRKLDKPTAGAIVVFSRGASSSQGHVGFYAGEKDGQILVLGGNQGNKVSIAPRSKATLLGYRWPTEVDLPPDVQPLSSSPVMQGAGTAIVGGAGVVVTAAGEVREAVAQNKSLLDSSSTYLFVLGAIIVVACIIVAISRAKAAKKLASGGV